MQDRTTDFRRALDSMRNRESVKRSIANRPGKQQKERSQFSLQFTDVSKRIHREIDETSEKLEKLQLLVAESGGLFKDNPVEIQELTYIIKQDIGRLNRANAQLKGLVSLNGGSGKQSHEQQHSSVIVVSLQNQLADISGRFKSALESRTTALQKAKKRRDELSPGWADTTAAILQTTSEDTPFLNTALMGSDAGSAADVSIDMPDSNNQLALLQSRDNYVQERADAMQTIESTIQEIGGIFSQLATMVHEQGEQIERIDHEVEATNANVEGALAEISKYYNTVSSDRWLMMKIFGVLLAFFIFFIVVVA
eukprot:m.394810 g.394810  ORF g.394810 m.394810 type:complete len:310 (+) comp21093_c0_seq1:189-1118(+)